MLFWRLSQAWKPERETPRTSQSQLTDQMWRCLSPPGRYMQCSGGAMDEGELHVASRAKKALAMVLARVAHRGEHFFMRSRSVRRRATFFLSAAISASARSWERLQQAAPSVPYVAA